MKTQVQISREKDEVWGTTFSMHSSVLEVGVTADIGPRVVHLARRGKENLFATFPPGRADLTPGEWQLYGGHRLWHSPEARMRTYMPDNEPVTIDIQGDVLIARQDVEKQTAIQKELAISFSKPEQICVSHRLINQGLWGIQLAPWAISVMAPGGFAITPLPTDSHPDRLLPNRTLSLWPYTDLRDQRYHFSNDYILVQQQPAKEATKIGVLNTDGWAAYYNQSFLFVKRFSCPEGAVFPDFQSSVEIYTNAQILELETLGGLVTLPPGESVTHVEYWEVKELESLSFSEEAAIQISNLVTK